MTLVPPQSHFSDAASRLGPSSFRRAVRRPLRRPVVPKQSLQAQYVLFKCRPEGRHVRKGRFAVCEGRGFLFGIRSRNFGTLESGVLFGEGSYLEFEVVILGFSKAGYYSGGVLIWNLKS